MNPARLMAHEAELARFQLAVQDVIPLSKWEPVTAAQWRNPEDSFVRAGYLAQLLTGDGVTYKVTIYTWFVARRGYDPMTLFDARTSEGQLFHPWAFGSKSNMSPEPELRLFLRNPYHPKLLSQHIRRVVAPALLMETTQ